MKFHSGFILEVTIYQIAQLLSMFKVLSDRLGADSKLKLKLVYQTSPNLLSLGFATLEARLDCLIDEHGFAPDDLRKGNPLDKPALLSIYEILNVILLLF